MLLARHLLFAVGLVWPLACPAAGGAARNDLADRIGVMTHFAHGWGLGIIPRLSEAGVRHVRDELYWEAVEPVRGRFVFPPRYDAYMRELGARDIRPLIALTFSNPHHDEGMTPYTDAGIAAYARYAVEVLRHHGPQIEAVEIWNEYNGGFAHGPVTQDRAGSYVRMLRVAHAAIKRERPDVTVLGAATAGVPLPYLERLFAAGALEYMDAVSIHPYRFDEPPEGIEQRIAALHTLIARYNRGAPKPVWVTEIGWPTRPGAAPGDPAINERDQAAYLVRAFALLLSNDVARAYWYLLKDYDQFATMGLVRDDKENSPKPAHVALATLLSRLAEAREIRREPAPEGVYCVRLDSADGPPTRLLWSLHPRPIHTAGATLLIDLRGKAGPPPAEYMLTDEPVYLVGEFSPPRPEPTFRLAESASGFSLRQGEAGWTYGSFVGASLQFEPLADSHATDWQEEWFASYPYFTLSAETAHPSAATDGTPVSAVRRWTSTDGGSLRVSGRFKSTSQGDGVRVRVLADGRPGFSESLGGGRGIAATFDLVCTVGKGGHLDFAVDPGPAGDVNYDATQVSITIHRL